MIMRAYKKYIITLGLVWAVALAIFVAAFFLLIAPQLKVAGELAKELAEKKKLCDEAVEAANEDNKKKLAAEVNDLKARLADFAVGSEESANLTFDVSRIARDRQVASFTIKTSEQSQGPEQTAPKSLQENHIALSFASDFRRFATFLNALERHRPVILVDKFKLTRAGPDDTNHKIDMDLTFLARKRPQG